MEVLDADGNNVAAKGTFKVADTSDTQKTITWTASNAYLGELNAKYGPNSDVHPTLTLKIPTSVKGVSIKKLERYKTANKDIIIPNTADCATRRQRHHDRLQDRHQRVRGQRTVTRRSG